VRGNRGGLAAYVRAIQADTGLSRRKAKRRFIRNVWRLTSPGLRALRRKQAGLSWGRFVPKWMEVQP
jgi:hypothetical protein